MAHPFWIIIQGGIGIGIVIALLVNIERALEWLERKLGG